MRCNKIAWVGEGYYSPKVAYGHWVFVGEEGKDDWRLGPVVYFATQDEFDRMIERKVSDDNDN